MNKIKLSFIIPVYNGEKFLRKCLNSLVNQKLLLDEFEIICVDDNSQDNSVTLIKQYCSEYSNIKFIQNKINVKTGTACNIGISHANGEYIWIIGQDDWIIENSLQELISICFANTLDVLAFNYKRVDVDEIELHSALVFNDGPIQKGSNFIHSEFRDSFRYYLLGYEWRAIFRKKFLMDKQIHFPDGAIYEDTTYLFKAILFSERFMPMSKFIYNYRVNDFSITDQNKKYRGSLIYEFSFVTGNEVLDLSNRIKDQYKEISCVLATTANWYFQSFIYKIIPSSIEEKKIFYELVRGNSDFVTESVKNTTWYVKILAHPIFGLFISTIIKPFYVFKRKLKNLSKPEQKWSY